MEKKQYIEPSMIVRHVGAVVMAAMSGHDEMGDGHQLSKELDLSEDNGNEGVATHDVWED